MPHSFKVKNKKGFASIIEVVVTTVVFMLATAGILSTLSMLQPHARTSTREIEAAYTGKGIIDDLRKEVAAETGGALFGPGLALGDHPPVTLGDYTLAYTITEPIPNVRKLSMTITW